MPSFTHDSSGKLVSVKYEDGSVQTRNASGGWTVKNPSLSSKPIQSGGGQTFHSIDNKPVTKEEFEEHTPPGYVKGVEEKHEPISSMSREQAEKEGYEYSGAVGWRKPKPTIKNVELMRAHAVEQREQLSQMMIKEQQNPSPEGTIYTVAGKQVSRTQYLNALARGQVETNAYINRLDKAKEEIQASERERSLNNLGQTQAKANPAASVISQPPVVASTEEYDREKYKKMYEQAKPHQKALLHASTLFSTRGTTYIGAAVGLKDPGISSSKDVIYERMHLAEKEGRGAKTLAKHAALNPVTFVASMTPVTKMVSWSTKAIGSVFGAQAAKGTAVGLGVGLPLVAGSSVYTTAKEGKKATAAGELATFIAGVGASVAGAKLTSPKYKVVKVQSAGPEEFSVTGKTGKGGGKKYSSSAQYDVTLEKQTATGKLLGNKPKIETQRANVELAGNMKKGTFDLDASVRTAQDEIGFARMQGRYKVQRTSSRKSSVETPTESRALEDGVRTINTEMDIYTGKAGKGKVDISAKGTRRTASTRQVYRAVTRKQVAGNVSIEDTSINTISRTIDDALSTRLSVGTARYRVVRVEGKGSITRGEGQAHSVKGGDVVQGGSPINYPSKPVPQQKPMKPMEIGSAEKGVAQAVKQATVKTKTSFASKAEVLKQAGRKVVVYRYRQRAAVNTANFGRIGGSYLNTGVVVATIASANERVARILQSPVSSKITVPKQGELPGKEQPLKKILTQDNILGIEHFSAEVINTERIQDNTHVPGILTVSSTNIKTPSPTTQTPDISIPVFVQPTPVLPKRITRLPVDIPRLGRIAFGKGSAGLGTVDKTIYHAMRDIADLI